MSRCFMLLALIMTPCPAKKLTEKGKNQCWFSSNLSCLPCIYLQEELGCVNTFNQVKTDYYFKKFEDKKISITVIILIIPKPSLMIGKD